MKRYLLDTSLVAAYLQNRKAAVELITPWIQNREAATSIIVYAEVTEYLKGLPDFPKRMSDLRTLLQRIYPYFLTYSILERYAEVRRLLRPPKGRGLTGDMDTLIAATAIERSLTIVTTDGDFERVPKLKVKRVSLKTT
jgi:predicted nucleic acid-binding protein